jgi:hypothetical protein
MKKLLVYVGCCIRTSEKPDRFQMLAGNDMPGQDCAQAFRQNVTRGGFGCGMKWIA